MPPSFEVEESMPKITFEADFDEKNVYYEDSRCAMFCRAPWEQDGDVPVDPDTGTCIKFWSWDQEMEHKSIKRFIGKRVRITVEVVSILDQIVEAVEKHAGLGFEIGDRVRFSCKRGNCTYARWNRESQGTQVVGLDITECRSIKVNFFISGSGERYEWFRPDELEKLSVLDKLAEV